MLVIRRALATQADAAAICQVEHASLGDSSYSPAHIIQRLHHPAHFPYLAWVEDIPVGFCWCLETPYAEHKRLEIDLLGVLPDYRGRGIATRMIVMARDEALQRGTIRFRAVVALDNLPSHHAFSSAGLSAQPEPAEMLVYRLDDRQPESTLPDGLDWMIAPAIDCRTDPGHASSAFVAELLSGHNRIASANCLLVETLVYRGVWIEQLIGEEQDVIYLLRGLLAWCARQALDELGILCTRDAVTNPGQFGALWRAGLESWGHFYIFN
jgi:GNAT superfamily N-acetyltransferase